ncbi:SEFIR domain-containing protein [Nocardia sp. NPDC004068]|uniref:SEFIR domain-containing protein n=1 Tax=Nocardia sp. NPDC004068 TaxID=3364303 RepID=UPI00367FFAED
MADIALRLDGSGMEPGAEGEQFSVGTIRVTRPRVRPIRDARDESGRAAYLLEFDFELEIDRAVRLSWFEIGLALDAPGEAAVVDAIPRTTLEPANARAYGVDRRLRFGPGETVSLPAEAATVDVFGLGGRQVRWRHGDLAATGSPVGRHAAAATVVVPVGCAELAVVVSARFDLSAADRAERTPIAEQTVVRLALPRGDDATAVVAAGDRPNPATPRPVRVFVSYAHDSDEHIEAVRRFGEFLAGTCGFDVHMDRWDLDRRRDWYLWATEQLGKADFVLIVASPRCRLVGEGRADNLANRGMQSEMALLREWLHADRATWTRKLLPVVLPGGSPSDLPAFLQPQTADHYLVTEFTIAGAEDLLRALTGQPKDRQPTPNSRPLVLPGRPRIAPGPSAKHPTPQPDSPPETPAPAATTVAHQGIATGAITAGGSVRISNKVVEAARNHPVLTLVVLVAVVGAILFALRAATGANPSTTAGTVGAESVLPIPPGTVAPASDTSGGRGIEVGPSAMVGTWTSSDGTEAKSFTENGGLCDGFFYSGGRPLDIGGPAYCTLSTKPDAANRYTLLVRQSVNSGRYQVVFSSKDHAAVYDSNGTPLYELSRF